MEWVCVRERVEGEELGGGVGRSTERRFGFVHLPIQSLLNSWISVFKDLTVIDLDIEVL